MEPFKILWSYKSKDDIRGIYDYIKDVLHEPQIAKKIVLNIKEGSKKLEKYYNIYPLISYKKDFRPIRKVNIKRYIVFYTIYEEQGIVYILRVFHERRDRNMLVN